MADRHEFFPQPRQRPPWCFCRDRNCPGWTAYLAWYQDLTGEARDPDDGAIETHRLVTELLADLTRHYSGLFGVNVDVNTALDLAHIERAAELGQIRQRGSQRPFP